MGLGGINVWQLLIILLIVVVIFGTKRLKSLGSDLGGAVKGFRKAVTEAEQAQLADDTDAEAESAVASEQSRERVDT